MDGLNTTTSRMAPQIDNIEERLEGTNCLSIFQQRLIYLHTAVSRRTEILEWISKIPYLDHHQRISEGRLDGTAEWLLRRVEYLEWESSSASKLLLLRGIRKSPVGSIVGFYCRVLLSEFFSYRLTRVAGAGKTYIASVTNPRYRNKL